MLATSTSLSLSSQPLTQPLRGRGCRSRLVLHAEQIQDRAPSDVAAAWELLKDFTKRDARGVADAMRSSAQQRLALKDALLLAASQPWEKAEWNPATSRHILLGLLASDVRFAIRALRDWTEAFDVEFVQPVSRVPGVDAVPQVTGPVYLKYNSATKLCYISKYEGGDRGVLISLGQQQLGHFPLGLFDESMSKPPPKL